MSDLLTQLAEIRARQGLEAIPDPHVIQGFGPSDPPPPAFTVPTSSAEFGAQLSAEDDVEDGPETYRSPLAAVASLGESSTGTVPALRVEPKLELLVCDTSAAYRGHAVELNAAERGEVVGVILRALQRVIEQQLDEVRALRLPSSSFRPGAFTPLSSPPTPSGRKRGRPRKARP